MPTDSYFYLEIQLDNCMIRFNMSVGPVRTLMTNTQDMNNYDMSTQNIPDSNVYYLDKRESERINVD